MSSPGKRKRAKHKEKDDARELWSPSPSPTEDWGSDADREWGMEIVGEEVGYGGNLKYEVEWTDWKRPDGTNTTWQGPNHLPTSEWNAKRVAALPNSRDIELWGTTDIVNRLTRERKQGYEEPTEQDLAAFQNDGDDMVRRMDALMADKKRVYPHLWPDPAPGRAGRTSTSVMKTTPAVATTAPLPRRSQVNAQAGPSRIHANAEAGPSRSGPRDTHSAPKPVAAKFRTPPAASSSRLPAPPPDIPTHPRLPPPRRGSPAISISSSVESIEFIAIKSKPSPAPGVKRKAASPPIAAPPPLPKRRVLPVPGDPFSAGGSGSLPHPRISAATLRSEHPRHSTSAVPSGRSTPTSATVDSSRLNVSAAPFIQARPPTACVGAGSSMRASTSTAAPVSPSLPRRLLKRKAADDSDDDDVSPRVCQCGTLLPPPDVHRLGVCDTCSDTAMRKRWTEKVARDRGGSSVSTTRSSSVSTMASSITNHRFERRHGNVEKAGTMSTVFVHRTPSSSGSPKRKGKARENAKSLRLQTETNWSTLAQRCDGAAGITFVNDVDDEEIPPSLHGGAFAYLEDKYHPSPTLSIKIDPESATPLSNPEGFPFCHCEERCDDLEECCQDNDVGYAYTDGLFNFTYEPDEVIVECNPYCNCPSTCGNRITQRPRCVPIEVFKTVRCGWGVRAPIDVVRGTVLGVYTGKLIPREEAEALTGEAKQYCFDLDYNEMGAAPDELYSVDSYKHGNWTRFINHSCAPNLRVQPVVYDTLPEQRIAFLAFIATEHIPAGKEFTFDYDPEAQRAYDATVHGKGKQARRPLGADVCVCDSGPDRCRGWVRT